MSDIGYYAVKSNAYLHAKTLEAGIESVEDAASETCDHIEYLEGELDDYDDTIKDLEDEIEELEKRLGNVSVDEVMRVLRNIVTYATDALKKLEVQDESTCETAADGSRDCGDDSDQSVHNESGEQAPASGITRLQIP